MKIMEERFTIMKMYHEGFSKREIAKSMKVGRHTVDRIVVPYAAELLSPQCDSMRIRELADSIKFNSQARQPRKFNDAIREEIDRRLSQNEYNKAHNMGKQQQCATDIYHALKRDGHSISYSSVQRYIKSKGEPKEKGSNVFLRLSYSPGEICEFDWGEFHLTINGKQKKVYMAVFTFSYSNGRYAWLFTHQNSLAFMESHRNFFQLVKGVPLQMVYDNMRVAVRSFVGEKQPTETLLNMKDFYDFGYRFCNARSGWEKGHVEKSVGYVRREAFAADTSFKSLQEAQEHLDKCCERLNTEERSLSTVNKIGKVEEDLKALIPCHKTIGCFELFTRKVDKSATITVGLNHYSVPETLVGCEVVVRLYSERVVVFKDGVKVAIHERDYGKGEWHVQLEHYLTTLSHKPGALPHCCAFKQAPVKLQKLFNLHFADCGKDFIELLQYIKSKEFTFDDIIQAADKCKKHGARHLSADMLKSELLAQHDVEMQHAENYTPLQDGNTSAEAISEAANAALDDITSVFMAKRTTTVITPEGTHEKHRRGCLSGGARVAPQERHQAIAE